MLGIDSRAARTTWTVALVVLALWLVYAIRAALFVFVLAVLFAYLLAPLVNLIDRLLPMSRTRTTALALAYVLMVGVTVLGAIAIGSRVVAQATDLAAALPAEITAALQSVRQHLPGGMADSITDRAKDLLSSLPKIALGFVTIASNLIYVVIIPILSFFFLKDGEMIRQHILGLVAVGPRRAMLDEVLADVHLLLAHYMRALVLLSLATFTAYSIFFTIIGIPYGILLGVLAGALEFIPMIGPLAAAVIILVVTGTSGGPVLAVLIFVSGYRVFQDYVVSPHLMGQGVELHPLLVLFGVFAGAEVAGIAGTFLSVPVLALARIMYRRLSRTVVNTAIE